MKNLSLILLFQFSTFCAIAQWTNLGLTGYQVNDLTVYGDTIYASTDDGIYKKYILTPDSIWTSCGMQGHNVVQTLVPNHPTFISVVTVDGTYTSRIYKSVDAGLSFSFLNSDISNYNAYQYLDHIGHPPNDYSTLYLLNHQQKTNDGGITWQPINNSINTDRFILVNPTDHAQIIIGGEGDLFNPLLQISNDYGETWDFPAMNSFFSGDNAIHDLAIDESIWYAAGEGVVCKTIDEGENWEQILDLFDVNSIFSLYYTNIVFSPVNKDILYLTGLNNHSANEVPLLISQNQGATWDSLSYLSPPLLQQIKCMTVENIDNYDYAFLGGKGVYLYKNSLTNVADIHTNLDFSIYPNPTATDRLNVKYAASTHGQVTVSVFDLRGRLLSRQVESAIAKQTFTIDTSALRRGTYVVQLLDGVKTGSREFVVH